MPIIRRFIPRNLVQLLLAAGFLSSSALLVALVAQYGFGLYPCTLCIYQRIPYALMIALVVVGLLYSQWRGHIAWLCALLFLVGAGIAAYHSGVEYGIFTGPTACSNSSESGQTLEELRAAILNAPLVSCSQAMVYVLGLSIASWNMFYSFIAFVFTVAMLRNIRRSHGT
jgi:disulfide bond formation protein DsbB